MEIKKITAGANCYLISEGDQAILIDCGLKGKEEKILSACKGKKINLILLTHGHMDHVQSVERISTALQAPVAMHKGDLRLLKDPASARIDSHGIMAGILRSFSLLTTKRCEPIRLSPSLYVKEGDSLAPYGIDGTIIELPGHTRGSIGVRTKKGLFVGDAMFAMVRPGIAALFEDEEAMKESVRKIQAMGDCMLYVGHGGPIRNKEWLT